jgi:hypothetical protein
MASVPKAKSDKLLASNQIVCLRRRSSLAWRFPSLMLLCMANYQLSSILAALGSDTIAEMRDFL